MKTDYSNLSKEELEAVLNEKRQKNAEAQRRYKERHPDRIAAYWKKRAEAKNKEGGGKNQSCYI